MAENLVAQVVPPGAIPIFLSLTGAGTIYTAVAKRRLHIVSMVISSVAGATGGVVTITVVPENGTSGTFGAPVPSSANVVNSATLDPIDLPTVTSVTTSLGASNATVVFTLVGWEEPTEK